MQQKIFSGIQPSGNLHIGNYLGAIQNWVAMQNDYESIFCIVDLHAITTPQNPKELHQRILEVAKIYLASGINPEKSTIFIQSHIKEHTELAWILNTITKNGDLLRMTQLKDKANLTDEKSLYKSFENFLKTDASIKVKKAIEKLASTQSAEIAKYTATKTVLKFLKEKYINPLNNSGVGLFDYPVLMVADILLYNTEVVPVGEDQLQHIELARTLARRFNKKFGEVFIVPKSHLKKETMRIMGLDDPTKKMSKSATSEYNYISLLDTPEIIEKKIKKAVTDSENTITYVDSRPALKNLINIYSAFSNKTPQEIEKEYQNKGYADFKSGLTKIILNFIIPFQEKYNKLDDNEVLSILKKGAQKIQPTAEQKIKEIKEKIGFVL